MILLRAAAISVTIGILCALAVSAYASPITDAYVQQYRDGTLFPDDPRMDNWRKTTSERSIDLDVIRESDTRTYAYFTERATVAGEPKTASGVIMIMNEGEKIVGSEWHAWVEAKPERDSQAASGQIADAASTGVALAAGLSEANQLGLLILPLKVVLYNQAKAADLHECMGGMKAMAATGWGAAGWNIGMVLGGPVVGIIGAIIGLMNSISDDEAAMECARV